VQRHFYRKHSQKAYSQDGLNLEQYIKVEQERVSRFRVLFHGVHFYLDQEVLQKIQQAQDSDRTLEISRQLLADLRYYALVSGENRLQSGLIFLTYYNDQVSYTALMRSFVALDGDIIHQIKGECLENPDFCRQLASAHYWLIDQLLGRLRMGAFLKLNLLSWVLSLLVVAGSMIPNLQEIIENPWMLLAAVPMSWLLQVGFKRLLILLLPTIRSWILRRLLSGLLSTKPRERKIAKDIMTWLG